MKTIAGAICVFSGCSLWAAGTMLHNDLTQFGGAIVAFLGFAVIYATRFDRE